MAAQISPRSSGPEIKARGNGYLGWSREVLASRDHARIASMRNVLNAELRMALLARQALARDGKPVGDADAGIAAMRSVAQTLSGGAGPTGRRSDPPPSARDSLSPQTISIPPPAPSALARAGAALRGLWRRMTSESDEAQFEDLMDGFVSAPRPQAAVRARIARAALYALCAAALVKHCPHVTNAAAIRLAQRDAPLMAAPDGGWRARLARARARVVNFVIGPAVVAAVNAFVTNPTTLTSALLKAAFAFGAEKARERNLLTAGEAEVVKKAAPAMAAEVIKHIAGSLHEGEAEDLLEMELAA